MAASPLQSISAPIPTLEWSHVDCETSGAKNHSTWKDSSSHPQASFPKEFYTFYSDKFELLVDWIQ